MFQWYNTSEHVPVIKYICEQEDGAHAAFPACRGKVSNWSPWGWICSLLPPSCSLLGQGRGGGKVWGCSVYFEHLWSSAGGTGAAVGRGSSGPVLLPCWCQLLEIVSAAYGKGQHKALKVRGVCPEEIWVSLSLLTMFDMHGESWPIPLLKGEEKKREYDSDGSTHNLEKSRTLFLYRRLFLPTGAGASSTADISVTNGIYQYFFPFYYYFFTHIPLPTLTRLMAVWNFHSDTVWNSFQPFWE